MLDDDIYAGVAGNLFLLGRLRGEPEQDAVGDAGRFDYLCMPAGTDSRPL